MEYVRSECLAHGKTKWKEYTSTKSKNQFQPCCESCKIEKLINKEHETINFALDKFRRCVKLYRRGHAWVTESAKVALDAKALCEKFGNERAKVLKQAVNQLKNEEGLETPRAWIEFFK